MNRLRVLLVLLGVLLLATAGIAAYGDEETPVLPEIVSMAQAAAQAAAQAQAQAEAIAADAQALLDSLDVETLLSQAAAASADAVAASQAIADAEATAQAQVDAFAAACAQAQAQAAASVQACAGAAARADAAAAAFALACADAEARAGASASACAAARAEAEAAIEEIVTAIVSIGHRPFRSAFLPPATHSTRNPIRKHTTPNVSAMLGAMTVPSSPVAAFSASNEAPNEPKEMAHACPNDGITTASTGAKPMPTIIGATTATGTPNPPAPCRKDANAQAKSRTCKVRPGEICCSIAVIAVNVPVASVMRKKNSAPQIM